MDEGETASSVGMVKPLIVGVPNGSMNKSFVSALVISEKSKETGSISTGLTENRSMALS